MAKTWTIINSFITPYISSEHEIFKEFGTLLDKYKDYILNSFIMIEKHGHGKVYDSRLSNNPMESINRKAKDLKLSGRNYRNFEHFRNRFLYATRQAPVLNGVTDYNPILYLDNDNPELFTEQYLTSKYVVFAYLSIMPVV